MSQLRKATMLSYVNIILTNVIGLVLTPFIIRSFGDSEYGLYTLIGAFVGYISVLDFGLNNAIVRYIAMYRAKSDKKGEENFLSTAMRIYAVISLIVIICGIILFFNLHNIFSNSLTIKEMNKAKIMFIILVFNLSISLPGGAFSAICTGYEHFVYPRMVSIIRYVIRSLTVVGLLLLGGDSVALVILDTILNVVVIAFNVYYVTRKLHVTFKFHSFDTNLMKHIFSYSFWIFVFAMVSQLQWKGGQIILGIKMNTTAVAIYAVGVVLGTYYSSFSGAISSVFLPRATQMIVNESSKAELTGMMIKIGRLSFLVLLLILGAFALYGKQFVLLWVGGSYKRSWEISLLIMIAYTLPLIQNFANSLLEANRKFYFKAIVYLICLVMGTILGYFLIDIFDFNGMIYGIITGWVTAFVIINIYYAKVMGLDIILFFKEVTHKTVPTFIMCFIIGFIINLVPDNGWMIFILKNAAFFCIYLFLMFFFALNDYEKNLIVGYKNNLK